MAAEPSSPANLPLDVLDLFGEGRLAALIGGPTLHIVRLQASWRNVADAAAGCAAPCRGGSTGAGAERAQQILSHPRPLHRTSRLLRCQKC